CFGGMLSATSRYDAPRARDVTNGRGSEGDHPHSTVAAERAYPFRHLSQEVAEVSLTGSAVSRHRIMLLGSRLRFGDGLIVAERDADRAGMRPHPMGIHVEAAPGGADEVGASAICPVGHTAAVWVILP